MEYDHNTDQEKERKSSSELLFMYILAGIGLACLIGWELSAVFSPSLSLLRFTDIETAAFLRIVAVLTLSLVYFVSLLKKDWFFERRTLVLYIGAFCALLTVGNTLLNTWIEDIPLFVSIIAWTLFGIAEACILMYWCILLTLLPTKRTAVVVSLGSCGGTLLFLLANSSATAWLDLIEISLLIIGSVGLAAFLSSHVPEEKLVSVKEYKQGPLLSIPAIFSALCQGAVYGFITLLVCLMGPVSALMLGVSGLIGSGVALIWGFLEPKVNIDTGTIQRISLPFLVGGLLFFPLFEGTGRIICGCVVNISLAHSQTIAWYSTSIASAELRLHPVMQFSIRQAPGWIGFLCGTILAFFFSFVLDLNDEQFMICTALFVLIVVVGFSIYGGNESSNKKRLKKLVNTAASEDADASISPVEEKNVPTYFKDRCEGVVKQYGLTTREAEVLFHLAKGRNAEYISHQLFVSSATVKSHIYHIYQKLNINSQQRLISIVDEIDLSKT